MTAGRDDRQLPSLALKQKATDAMQAIIDSMKGKHFQPNHLLKVIVIHERQLKQ